MCPPGAPRISLRGTIRLLSPEERSSGVAVEDAVEIALNRFFRKRTERQPVIVPVAIETGR